MPNSSLPIVTRRPDNIRTAIWLGWIWFALVFFNPFVLWNLSENFDSWLFFIGLFGGPLTLVSKRQNIGRLALNVILVGTLLFATVGTMIFLKPVDFSLEFKLIWLKLYLQASPFLWPHFLLLAQWLPILFICICLNDRTSREWLQSDMTPSPELK